MPRERRANIGRRTRHASQQQVYSRNLREERQNIIRENDRLRHRVSTRRSLASYNRLAFQYDPTANYSDDENLDIGRMTTICRYCNALKFKRETVGLCCASGKVKLDPLLTPPQPLKTLFDGSDPMSNISRSSAMGKLLMQCKLIVWDECTMAHKKSLEALNFTLKDLRRNNNIFGGLMILLAGDFRQTLPVVPRGTPADELNACLKASPLWNNVKTLSLTTNMRVQLQNDQSAAQFSKQLLDLGNGKVPVDATSGLITLTNDFCRFVDTQLVLIENVFPNISENYKNYAWLSQRAILAAKNNDVHALNFTIQSKIAGDLVTYKSVDSITNPDDVVNYPTEFLNSLEIPGLPPHNLQLKVGTVILILRNLNPPRLCNGTRLSVKRLMPNLIEATIINGKYAGENVCIPRIPMIPTDLPFDFKRLQFPVRLAFAMTINKSQGQSLSVCGINLENHCFSHGQLYVACSRVGKPSALFVLTSDQKTKNVVYQRALQ
ncbi:ATP-dependent DNA helicase pif1-like [Metopolophium dirhodum]|uniref:ATP-dependent DNA helicase pif1-like n=1 Tax=Metopolophium dirhodum TaxID=44670 RepID=UPI00299010FC|nr:ATP-dependent DNA helicase pif1-like [Metopolophium dirhodum]